MESSWQRKCAPMWQSSAASVFSSSQHHQNQILSGGYHLHSPVQVKPSSSIRRLVPEAVNPWSSNLSSNNLSLTEPASSFLSLLSGPPCINPNELPVSGTHASGCEVGSEVSLLSSGSFAEYLGSQYPEAGADPGLCVSSKARISANHGSNSVLNIVRHGCYRDLQQQLELPKADTHSKLFSNGIRMNFSSGRVGHVNGATAPNVRKIQSSNTVGVSQRVPLKTDSAVSCLSSSVLAGCPQVFCLGLSGVLLLSNTGFLGVLCSCHGLHMSISKFSEHSGLCNVNPGNAVHMDSGETIAQWRKAFCRKFGIRIPEDHSGWDWPQGLSVTTGLVQHGPTLPIMSTDSNLCNQTSSFGASVHSLNQLSQILHPKNAQTGEKVDEFMPREKQKSTHGDSSLLFKGLSSSSKNSLHFVADDHMTGYSRSGCSTMPNLVGIRGHYNVCPVISSYKDPLCESGGFVFPPDMQNLNTLEKDTAVGRSVGPHVDRDTVSSNVELRLGQPSQQNQASESSILSASGSHLLFHGQPRKSVFLDQHLYGSSSSRSIEVSRQHNYLAGIMSSSSTRTEKTQLNDLNHACGAYRVPLNVSQFKQLNKNAPGSVAASESFANLRSPCEGKNHCKSINGSINVSHAVVSKLQSGSSPARSGQFGFPSPRDNVPDTDFFTNILDGHKHEKVENVRHTTDGLHGTAELNLGSHTKPTGRMLSSGGVAGDSDLINYPVSHGKVPNMCQSTGMMANVPDVRNSYFGQVSCPAHSGQCDPNYFRTISSPMDLGTILSSEVVSLGNSATNSIPGKSFTASAYKRNGGGSPFCLDETLKMLAFQPMSALSDQNLSTSTSKTISVQEESQNYGKTQVIIPPGLRQNVCNRTNVPKASEVATHPPASANLRFGGSEKLPSVIDTSKRCDFQVPAVSQGWYSHGRDTEAQFQFHSDLEQTRQFFLRVGVNGNIASSREVGNCYQELPHGYFPSKCSFSRKSDNLTGRHHLTGDPSLGEFGEKEGNAVDLGASFFGPKFGKIFTFTEKDNSFGQTKSMVQNMKKSECNSFQWRDVPRKVVKDASEAATKCSEKAAHHTLKEQETSNLSSGCSAPAITQASIEANNKDSYTVDGAVADNLVVDEGSGIERCYSSDGDSERSAEFYGFPSKFNLVDKQSSKENVSKLSLGLFDELRFRDLLKFKKMQCQSVTSFPIQENDSRRGKRKTVKWKRLDSSVSASALPAAQIGASKCAGVASQCFRTRKNIQTLPQGDQQSFTGCPCSVGQNLKRRESTLSSSGAVSWKRDLTLDIEVEKTDSETNLNAKSDYSEGAETMQRKRLRLVGDTEGLEQDDMHDSTCIVSEITTKVTTVDCNATSSKLMNSCHRKRRRPVVHGKYGIISNGNHLKPAKIVSLKMINKVSRRYSFAESGKLDFATVKESKRAISNTKKEVQNGVINMFSPESNSQHSGGQKEMAYFLGSKDSHDLSHTMKKRRHDGSRIHSIPDSNINTDLRRKCKEVRKRSVNELTKGNDSSCVKSPILKDGKAVQSIKGKFISKLVDNAGDDGLSDEKCNDNKGAKVDSFRKNRDLGVFCCVCGSSNKDDSNCLLECNHCLIKVHQACYGVSKVPKARWYCRPCKTNSKNIVCVLCGYGGGAMTRALRTRNVVKSLLRSWSITTKSNSENLCISESLGNLYKMLPSTKSVGVSDPFLIIRPAQMESPSVALWNSDLSELADTVAVPSSTSADPVLCNSIAAGVFDSTVKQWVHMVCGLWTPGTRCPNVDTMSAFDVSGACRPKQDVVCSICQRSGGTCIQCRVTDCYIQFHPWCAHQKGLLQSEVEGVDNESVGFYGRCMLHAMHQQFDSGSYHTSSADHGERESTCARTEGYKGRKQDGFHDNRPQHSEAGTGCLVPQEQLNAWIHIHGQKSCTREPLKLPTSVIEYDCRKEYARYKQSRGWKHLVVYKSGIHGLGLYTSQFISRGAMVVEYVGEIVGLHVADKRETEYQAGKKLQYKSACYFFRIDKEHIIDATRKGGIARFVNHSCLPNCVAKVISVRNEKKVVFFAERDIYPGEEVTYDYHFNHEDEGKKLPCYCNSKNCRRYLN